MALLELTQDVITVNIFSWLQFRDIVKFSEVSRKAREVATKGLKFVTDLEFAQPVKENQMLEILIKHFDSTKLQTLRFRDQHFTFFPADYLAPVLNICPSLNFLEFKSCLGSDFPFPNNCYRNLSTFHISFQMLQDLSILASFQNLKELALSGIKTDVKHVGLFSAIIPLKHLSTLRLLDGDVLESRTFEFLSNENFEKFEVFELTGYFGLFLSFFQNITEHGNLRKLILEGPNIDEFAAKEISKFSNLTHLKLWRQRGDIGDTSLELIARNLIKLVDVRFIEVSHFGFSLFAQNCRFLTCLIAHECAGVGDFTLKTLGERCPFLEQLDVSFCNGVTDQGLVLLCATGNAVLDSLVNICVAHCSYVTNQGFRALGNCRKLKFLDVEGLHALTDAGVIGFAQSAKAIVRINFSWCYKLTILSLEMLINDCYCVSEIILNGCAGLQQEDLNLISRLLKAKFKLASSIPQKQAQRPAANSNNIKKTSATKKKNQLPDFESLLSPAPKLNPDDLLKMEKQYKQQKRNKKKVIASK